MQTLLAWVPLVFLTLFFASVGASLGSLINVLVYRMPRGEGVVTPPSRCPKCGTRLTWRENIPVFGWLLLRGKCRFCHSPISARYPTVEAAVGLLFGGLFFVWYGMSSSTVLGLSSGPWSPEWADNGLAATWPIMVVVPLMMASLVAMTLIDAETFTIPLVLAWVPSVAAVVILPLHALWWEIDHGSMGELSTGLWIASDGTRWRSARGWMWSLPTPGVTDWRWIGASIGGVVGLGVSAVLVKVKVLGRSFADYESWEAEAIKAQEANDERSDGDAAKSDGGAEMWVQYPHARREMVRELAFLAVPVGLAYLGWWGFNAWAPGDAPLWLCVLSGVLWGYLVGGGVVWAVRIGGSLGFGKEAMGIGDVHLMAAVGACFGWIDATLAFFVAPFFGLAWAVAGAATGGKLRRAMPYGPFLAGGTFVVVVFKPVFEAGLTILLGGANGVDLP